MKFIDLISFLRDYYGISNPSLKFDKLKHSDIKILFPYIKRCFYDDAFIDDISRGNIIGVYDKNNRIVYYYNPHLLITDDNISQEDYSEEEKKVIKKDLDNLSKEELLKIRSNLRKNGNKEEAYEVTKQIRKLKEEEPREYHKRKEKIRIKERYYD